MGMEALDTIRPASWLAVSVLSCGALMVAIDATVVNIAVPFITRDLRFPNADLTWVTNAYLCTYGGFLPLAGRLGDFLGYRRVFIFGILIFTSASLICGVATAPWGLIIGRALQGFAGASTSTAAAALIRSIFSDDSGRARALGIFSLIGAVGSAVGVLVGGTLTALLGWHWIFFINIPVGIGVCIACLGLIPVDRLSTYARKLDIAGATTITASLTLANFALVTATRVGWDDLVTLVSLLAAGVFMLLFVYTERRVQYPILPLGLFRSRNLVVVSFAGAFLSSATLSWMFVSSFYLQFVFHLTSWQAGAAFLPVTVSDAFIAIVLVPTLISRFGLKLLIAVGMLTMSGGILLFTVSATHVTLLWNVIPGMILLGSGMGLTYGPLFLSVVNGAPDNSSGMISGAVYSAWILGGTLGFAILVGAGVGGTGELLRPLADGRHAHDGYQVCFYFSALAAAGAAALSMLFIRSAVTKRHGEQI